ncbi:hypothetical protein [Aquimarina macrocephali]|uniref:hypothetical protein n=1 Tax=Aquimarina macrocephali TaxID=666563 RepID=UPI0004B703AE|nr:hypothetical protein [Aquimarina macrocephali]
MKNILILLFFCILSSFLGCNEKEENFGPLSVSQDLEEWLAKTVEEREVLENLDFSKEPLSKSEAEIASELLFQDKQARMFNDYETQWNNRLIEYNSYKMLFFYQTFGAEPSDGRSLFISLHGGGGTTAAANDQQYDNQKHLYDVTMSSLEGVYLAPRAPTNTWNLWHEDHIDEFLNIIIQLAVLKENVNPNKVYLLGYSAGGDGSYQLAPRMADRWAAASMMAGHPNDASPLGLRNTPFAIHVGGNDSAFNRNGIAEEWGIVLDNLQNEYPDGYIHDVQIHEGFGHWMELEDAVALPWMTNYERNPIPKKVNWKQDDRHHSTFYWVGTPKDQIETDGEILVEYNTELNEINIVSNYSNSLQLYINDEMLNLNDTVTIKYQGQVLAQKIFNRSILNIYESLSIKGDSNLSFPCVISVTNNETVQ